MQNESQKSTRQSQRPLRILELATHSSLNRGGAIQMIRLARGLAEMGHRVTAAFNVPADAIPTNEVVDRTRAAGAEIIGLKLNSEANKKALRELWQAEKFDVLHCHREEALLFAADALAGLDIPCLVAQRGTVYLPGWFSAEHRLLWGRRVDRIIAVAEAVKRSLARRRLVSPRKIEFVYGGYETDVFHPGVDGRMTRLRLGVPTGSLVVTLPGALVVKKGTEFFIEAAARIRKHRQGIQFWIVGRGKREEEMKALAESLDMGPTMHFLGQIDNIAQVYAASDLVVCSSIKGEGLTGTLREAMAMERPVVTTDVAGNTELVEDGVTGFVARPGDPASLAEAILNALRDTETTRRLARQGRERVERLCNESLRSQKVEAIYRDVLKKKGLL